MCLEGGGGLSQPAYLFLLHDPPTPGTRGLRRAESMEDASMLQPLLLGEAPLSSHTPHEEASGSYSTSQQGSPRPAATAATALAAAQFYSHFSAGSKQRRLLTQVG